MEETFEEMYEKAKKQDLNPETTRKFLLKIKEYMDEIKQADDENMSASEIKEIFEEEYKKDLSKRVNAGDILILTRKYDVLSEAFNLFKGNKNEFNRKMKMARSLEDKSSTEKLELCYDKEKDIIGALRYVLRCHENGKKNSRSKYYRKNEIEILRGYQLEIEEELKELLIKGIQLDISYLDQNGLIEDYIEEINNSLEKMNLSALKLQRRNPITNDETEIIPDGIILPLKDENGNEIKYSKEDSKVKEQDEDIGFIDMFETENLEKSSIDDLLLLHMFWKSSAVNANFEMSKARNIIKYFNLWEKLVDSDNKIIEDFELKDIEFGLKKDLAMTYMCRSGVEISDDIIERYISFTNNSQDDENNKDKSESKLSKVKKLLKSNKAKREMISQAKEEVEEEIVSMKDEIVEFNTKIADLLTLECMVIDKLQNKNFKGKIKWGIIDDSDKELTFAIDNSNFRSLLIMSIYKNDFNAILGEETLRKIPEFKGDLNSEYTKAMDSVYLPKSKNFINTVEQGYKQNPSSSIMASLARKKVKPNKNNEGIEL